MFISFFSFFSLLCLFILIFCLITFFFYNLIKSFFHVCLNPIIMNTYYEYLFECILFIFN